MTAPFPNPHFAISLYCSDFRNPAPQVAEGIWLGERPEVHAMMDISDGIASDLRHILHQSGVGAEVDTECISRRSRNRRIRRRRLQTSLHRRSGERQHTSVQLPAPFRR